MGYGQKLPMNCYMNSIYTRSRYLWTVSVPLCPPAADGGNLVQGELSEVLLPGPSDHISA